MDSIDHRDAFETMKIEEGGSDAPSPRREISLAESAHALPLELPTYIKDAFCFRPGSVEGRGQELLCRQCPDWSIHVSMPDLSDALPELQEHVHGAGHKCRALATILEGKAAVRLDSHRLTCANNRKSLRLDPLARGEPLPYAVQTWLKASVQMYSKAKAEWAIADTGSLALKCCQCNYIVGLVPGVHYSSSLDAFAGHLKSEEHIRRAVPSNDDGVAPSVSMDKESQEIQLAAGKLDASLKLVRETNGPHAFHTICENDKEDYFVECI